MSFPIHWICLLSSQPSISLLAGNSLLEFSSKLLMPVVVWMFVFGLEYQGGGKSVIRGINDGGSRDCRLGGRGGDVEGMRWSQRFGLTRYNKNGGGFIFGIGLCV